ncbi:MAG: hypothetical protein ACXAD7_05235 [Candidatus Kariarchaeaceae archaeon]
MKKQTLYKFLILPLALCLLLGSTQSPQLLIPTAGEPNSAINPVFASQFGTNGSGPGEFYYPRYITSNATHMFVSDGDNHRVQIFDLDGNYMSEFGELGTGIEQFNYTCGVALNDSHIFVVDANNYRVQMFTPSGYYAGEFGSYGSGDGQFTSPRGIAVNDTHIFVTDIADGVDRVQIFDLAGNYQDQFGGTGGGDGQLNFPHGIAINGTHIFIAEASNHRASVFDAAGNFVDTFAGFWYPYGISISGERIYVSDTGNYRIRVFDQSGPPWNHLRTFGTYGTTGNGNFDHPFATTLSDDHLIVLDAYQQRIQMFQRNYPPEQLTAHTSSTGIGLTWNPPIDSGTYPVSTYRLYKGTSSGVYTLLLDTPYEGYFDDNVVLDTTYYYAITAVTASGESMYSNELSAQLLYLTNITLTTTHTQFGTETEPITYTQTDTESLTITNTETGMETSTISEQDTITQVSTSVQDFLTFPWIYFVLVPSLLIVIRRRKS